MQKTRIPGHSPIVVATDDLDGQHCCNHGYDPSCTLGMVGIEKPKEMVSIVMGNKQVKSKSLLPTGVVCDNQGNQKLPVKMSNVGLVPDCVFNLFSISKQLKQGWTLGGNAEALVLISSDGKHQIKFDIKILMPTGTLFAMYVKCTQEQVVSVATTNDGSTKQVMLSAQQAQERLGHINERTTKEIATSLAWKLTGN